MIKYTIIMPVYNAENFLSKNLTFFKNIKRDDIELLIVNDGSTDNSLEIIKSYSIKNCTIIDQENHGVSYSRNVGIKKAKGKYISFLDCDDFLNDNIFETIDKYINDNYDVIRYSFSFFNGEEYTPFKLAQTPMVYRNKKVLQLQQDAMSTFKYNSIWNQFIRKSLLEKNEIYFNEKHKYAEDLEFNLKLFSKATSVCILPNSLYFYYINENGITRNKSYENIKKCTDDAIEIYVNNIRIAQENEILNKRIILHSIEEILTNIKKIFLNKTITKEQKETFIKYIREKEDIHFLEKKVTEYKVHISLINRTLLFSKKNKLVVILYSLWGNKK